MSSIYSILIVVPAKYMRAEDFPVKKGKPWITPGAAMAVAAFTREVARNMDILVRCEIWDEHVSGPIPAEKIADANLVLLTFLTPSRLGAYRIAQLAKDRRVPVIAGGIDITGACLEDGGKEEFLQHFNAIFCGRLTRNSWRHVLHDWYYQVLDGNAYSADRSEPYEFILPEWRLIDLEAYMFPGVQSSAGCPETCEFCGVYLITGSQRVHYKPIEILMTELEYLKSKGVKIFLDYSDCFGVNRAYYNAHVLPLYKSSGMMWITEISVKKLIGSNGESGIIEEMAASGCIGVYLGIESLAPGATEKNREGMPEKAIKWARRLGMLVLASLILDHDEDANWQSVKDTLRQLTNWGAGLYQFSLITLIPGTPLRTQAIEDGTILSYDPRDCDGSRPMRAHQASPEERVEWLRWCYKHAYSPLNIIRLLCWIALHRLAILPVLFNALVQVHWSTNRWKWRIRTK